LTFSGLHSVISQKVELFITTAERTSKPTCDSFLENRVNIKSLMKVMKNTTDMYKILQQVYGEGRVVEYRFFTSVKPQISIKYLTIHQFQQDWKGRF
jgi:hypothetical protein